MRKKGNTVLAGLIICLLLVFLAAAGKLFGAYLKYQKGDVSYEKLQEYVQEPEEEESPESEKEKEEPKNICRRVIKVTVHTMLKYSMM